MHACSASRRNRIIVRIPSEMMQCFLRQIVRTGCMDRPIQRLKRGYLVVPKPRRLFWANNGRRSDDYGVERPAHFATVIIFRRGHLAAQASEPLSRKFYLAGVKKRCRLSAARCCTSASALFSVASSIASISRLKCSRIALLAASGFRASKASQIF